MIFDTNIFIYANKRVLSAHELLRNTKNKTISAVTYMEYVPYCRNKKELMAFENLLETFDFKIYEIDKQISWLARQIVKQFALSHSIDMGDALIAATALSHDELLCTSNVKHFLPIDGLKLEIYSPIKKD
ncbi:MAG: type II toxin-antitoxin system VapC family toxin [Methylococcales bacterium]|nr:type II toxin-antitoxin system VapC family toxin [Methylococcales bacterium]